MSLYEKKTENIPLNTKTSLAIFCFKKVVVLLRKMLHKDKEKKSLIFLKKAKKKIKKVKKKFLKSKSFFSFCNFAKYYMKL